MLVTWIMIFVVGMSLALLWALAKRLVSLPRVDWTPWINAPLAGATMALAAFAVGRSIVRPVST